MTENYLVRILTDELTSFTDLEFWQIQTKVCDAVHRAMRQTDGLDEFINARKDILSHCGGWSIDKDLFLENTKERFSNTNKKSKHTQLPKTSCSIQMPEVALYRNPKVIAKIKLCGAVTINIDEDMAWKKPTDEQIKNLHDLFCIDVEILDRGE